MTKKNPPVDGQAIVDQYAGIKLDIGCGGDKLPGFVGIDILPLPGVDIVHNLENTPWPLPDECAHSAVASHVLEHLSPGFGDRRLDGLRQLLIDKKLLDENEVYAYCGADGSGFINVMNEIWRVLKVGGQFAFVVPHASSSGYQQDPTHQNMINQNTMRYFDPLDPSNFYHFYEPKPWEIQFQSYNMDGNLEVILRKRADDPSYHRATQTPKDIVQEVAKQPKSFVEEVRSL